MLTAPRHNPTILDVAREARASKTSVSRYFGHERERLSAELQARIATAAQRLSYRPNRMARGLKGGHSGLVGMLVADIRNPFSVAVMHGIEQACRERGLSLMVCNTDNDPAQERAYLELLASYRVEGLVINAVGSPDRELQTLVDQGIPLVLLDRDVGSVDAEVVGLDNQMAMEMALDHLQAQGYRTLLYVSEPPAEASSRRVRLDHFKLGCEARALDGRVHGQRLDDEASLRRAIVDFLSRQPASPRALLCANGRVTLVVARILQELGATLGETGLIGIDELDWCALINPGITTLAQPTEAIGRAALQRLLAGSAGGDGASAPRRLHPPTLMARGSTRR
ncbi:MAG TPA: substrate-binding domain-containing protein [Halomonas sp.]|nr:substrate-binding domain-containing protein [Halomonas sp.]